MPPQSLVIASTIRLLKYLPQQAFGGLVNLLDSLTVRAYDAMNDAVAACYGFACVASPVWRDGPETLRKRLELNHQLAEPVRCLC